MCSFSPFTTTTTEEKPPRFIINPKQSGDQWYHCAVCIEPLFKTKCVVGSMGFGRNYLGRRLLIIQKQSENDTNMIYVHRYCNENVRQQAVYCPKCLISLNLPVQSCLGRTIAPVEPRAFRKYKHSLQSFSKIYHVIRISLLAPIPM